jgi:ABC-type branched-subunit amino acid transport system ATPase component
MIFLHAIDRGFADDIIRANTTIQSLSSASSKPSFLLWDKVYQKVLEVEDQTWLLRAGSATFSFLHDELAQNLQLR